MSAVSLLRVLPLLCLVLLGGAERSDTTPARVLSVMYDSIHHVQTLRMKVGALERIEKKYLGANSEIKVQTTPRMVYFINRARRIEVLYNSEKDPSRALVKPNLFPGLPLSLDPGGSLMRRNQHYTLHELGFEFIGKSVALTLKKDKEGLANFRYHGKAHKNGYSCYLLEYQNQKYGYVDYTVGEKETATLIAYRLCVNDYLLRYRNDLLNDFGFLKKGRRLKVPNLYCKRAVIYIDDHLMLPVSISLYDDKGLFESYDFSDIQVNKPFRPGEFEREFREYGF
jgi:hypothetical protein